MAMHAPAIRPHFHLPAIPNLIPAATVVILAALLALAVLLMGQPRAATPTTDEGWMTRDRQEEITQGHTGPNTDVLLFRQGEFAGN